MFGELRLLFQVGDFIVKAVKEFAASEAGQKELQDIEDALTAIESGSSAENPSGSGTLEQAVMGTLEQARAALKSRNQSSQ